MKKNIIVLTLLLAGFSHQAFGWGHKGHDAVASIAERNLTAKAKANIEKYLGGRSIVYYASWMDCYRTTDPWKETTSWHTAPVDADYNYTDALKNPDRGNAIYGLEYAIANLKNYKNLDDSTVRVNLYYVIHIVGDMHCPTHVKYTTVNTNFKVKVNGREIKYHSVWDTNAVEGNHDWSYTEWADQLDRKSKQEKADIVAGSPRDWFHQSAVDCVKIYDMAKPGDEIITKDRVFLNGAVDLVDSQITKAGYRLAKVLNDLFAK